MPTVAAVKPTPDLLDLVVAELQRRKGELPAISRAAGVAYDTVHRIKNRENDPGYSRVRRLAAVLGIQVDARLEIGAESAAAAQAEEVRDAA